MCVSDSKEEEGKYIDNYSMLVIVQTDFSDTTWNQVITKLFYSLAPSTEIFMTLLGDNLSIMELSHLFIPILNLLTSLT